MNSRVALLLLLLPLASLADTFELRDGTQVKGTLVGADAGGAVIRCDAGELTFDWGFFRTDVAITLWQGALPHLDADGCCAFAEFAKRCGQADKARAGWEAAIAKDPDQPKARFELGYTRKGGEWVKGGEKKPPTPPPQPTPPAPTPPAKNNLKAPEGTPPTAAEADAKGGLILEEAKKQRGDAIDTVERAIKELEKAVRLAPKFALPYYHLGVAYQYTKEYEDARTSLEKALAINPDFFEAMSELGDTYVWLKDYDKATAQYKRAIELSADYAPPHRGLGMVLVWQRKYAEGRDELAKAAALDKSDAVAASLLVMVQHEVDGPGWKTTYKAEGEHFVVTTDDSQDLADLLLKHAEVVYKLYTQFFNMEKKEERKFPILVFKEAKDYQAYGGPANTGGYYNPWIKNLVFFKEPKFSDTQLVLYHEAFHQYLAYYLEDAPQWFNEGHGDYFGPSEFDEGKKTMYIRVNHWRLGTIQGAIRNNQYQPLDKLMLMTQDELYDPRTIGVNYAESWSFIYFLWQYNGGEYAPILKAYFKKLREGAGLKKAWSTTFARCPMQQIEKEWKEFILSLK